jgi:hypothetical protein
MDGVPARHKNRKTLISSSRASRASVQTLFLFWISSISSISGEVFFCVLPEFCTT